MLVIILTGSIFSFRPPAETNIFKPARRKFSPSVIVILDIKSGISIILPMPFKPLAIIPNSGPAITNPRWINFCTFSWFDGFWYMCASEAGAKITGQLEAIKASVSASFAKPFAIWAILLIVAGAMTNISAFLEIAIWSIPVS